ncbi:YOS9 [[Candida] subhashii]|uniref:Endoplasmic reticulum lectin n=1 Tax=[Candida] subhashii TaxID=561895 RepID=A0A8J5UXR7_9ASCO|nr:YOS9 [[Candida] subhashii]KAG7663800.1 YOS9 [[Candida] subhashii]
MGLNQEIKHKGQFEILNINNEQQKGSYLCHLPHNQQVNITIPESKIPPDELKNKAIQIIYNSFINQNCTFSYNLHAGYWTIGYCFGDKVIQFHEDLQSFVSGDHKPHLPKHIYTLGRFEGTEKLNKRVLPEHQTKGHDVHLDPNDFIVFEGPFSFFSNSEPESEAKFRKLIKHTLFSGEICDVTRKPRTIDIVYKCDQFQRGVNILEIHEIKTCEYQMIINVPGLCALDEFKSSNTTENIVDIQCKNIDETNLASADVKYEDFFQYLDKIPSKEPDFPQPGVKINVNEYTFYPIGNGFFLGYKHINSGDLYWDQRHIFLYSGTAENLTTLEKDFGTTYYKALESKIPSPIYFTSNTASALQSTDAFVAWYELYDYKGDFIALLKVSRDGSERNRRKISVDLVDTKTWKDLEGKEHEHGLHEILANRFTEYNWNFVEFERLEPGKAPKKGHKNKKKSSKSKSKDIKTAAVTVTDSKDPKDDAAKSNSSKIKETVTATVTVTDMKQDMGNDGFKNKGTEQQVLQHPEATQAVPTPDSEHKVSDDEAADRRRQFNDMVQQAILDRRDGIPANELELLDEVIEELHEANRAGKDFDLLDAIMSTIGEHLARDRQQTLQSETDTILDSENTSEADVSIKSEESVKSDVNEQVNHDEL